MKKGVIYLILFSIFLLFIINISEAKNIYCLGCTKNLGYSNGFIVSNYTCSSSYTCNYCISHSKWIYALQYAITCDVNNCQTCSNSTGQCASLCSSGQVCYNKACCTPSTCSSLGYNCGPWSNGCGTTLSCGTCNPTSETCSNGICVCKNECTPYNLTKTCTTGAGYTQCFDNDADGCYELVPKSCTSPNICKNKDCCRDGGTSCSSKSQCCSGVCTSGKCTSICTAHANECLSSGVIQCLPGTSNKAYRLCGDTDSDSCLEWQNLNCPSGQICDESGTQNVCRNCYNTGETTPSASYCCSGLTDNSNPPKCIAACTGCKVGSTCYTQNTNTQCGSGGSTCVDCTAQGKICSSGQCITINMMISGYIKTSTGTGISGVTVQADYGCSTGSGSFTSPTTTTNSNGYYTLTTSNWQGCTQAYIHITKSGCTFTSNNVYVTGSTVTKDFTGNCVTPCQINSATITSNCAGGTSADCEQGETIAMSLSYTGDCSATKFLQIDASGTGCNIQYSGGDISGISKSNPTITGTTSGTITGIWTIPTIPTTCQGKTISATAAGLYSTTSASSSSYITSKSSGISGSFKFKAAQTCKVNVQTCSINSDCCSNYCNTNKKCAYLFDGYVRTSTGEGIGSVTVSADCTSHIFSPLPPPITTTTSSNGYYLIPFIGCDNSDITTNIQASKSGCTFTPSSTSLPLGRINQNITGTGNCFSILYTRAPTTTQTNPFKTSDSTSNTFNITPWSLASGKDWIYKSKTTDTITNSTTTNADQTFPWSSINALNACNTNGYCTLTGTWTAAQFKCNTNVNNIRKVEEWFVINGVASNHNTYYFKCSDATTTGPTCDSIIYHPEQNNEPTKEARIALCKSLNYFYAGLDKQGDIYNWYGNCVQNPPCYLGICLDLRTCITQTPTTITGYVRTSTGTGISGAIVTAAQDQSCMGVFSPAPSPITTTTSSTGYYTITTSTSTFGCTIAHLSASKSGCTFIPSSTTTTLTGSTITQDFTGSCTTSPCQGSCLVNSCLSYSSCASLAGVCSGSNYCCTGICTTPQGTYNISGYTLTSSNVAISSVNIQAKIGSCPGSTLLNTYTTNAQGYYFISSTNQQLCLTPSKTDYTFEPLTYSASLSSSILTRQNFTGTSVPICSLSDAYFAKSPNDNTVITSAIEGDSVNLIVKSNSNCNGRNVTFTIKEYDTTSSDDPVSINPQPATFTNGQAKASWIAEWQDDGLLGGDPEYYFTAYEGVSNSISSGTTSDRLLSVSKSSAPGTCGNGAINSGEDCDGSNLNSKTCSSLGWDSGTLKCDESCHFDFSSCYDTTTCGDGTCVHAAGEYCNNCPQDCGSCEGTCGDGTCQEQESCLTCTSDCGICSNNQTTCGDNICDHKSPSNEYCNTCEQDCGACEQHCQNNYCDPSESCSSCKDDCGPCIGGPCNNNNKKEIGEECDGTDLNSITKCEDINSAYNSGTLTCSNCLYDESNCKTSSQCAYDCSANSICQGNCAFSSKCTEDPDCKCSDYVEFGYSECTKDECLDGWDTNIYKNQGTNSGCCALPDCYPSQCYSAWECSEWSTCNQGKKTRTCNLKGGTTLPQGCPQYSPDTQKTCLTEAEFPFFSPIQIIYVILLLIAFYGYKLKRKH